MKIFSGFALREQGAGRGAHLAAGLRLQRQPRREPRPALGPAEGRVPYTPRQPQAVPAPGADTR